MTALLAVAALALSLSVLPRIRRRDAGRSPDADAGATTGSAASGSAASQIVQAIAQATGVEPIWSMVIDAAGREAIELPAVDVLRAAPLLAELGLVADLVIADVDLGVIQIYPQTILTDQPTSWVIIEGGQATAMAIS